MNCAGQLDFAKWCLMVEEYDERFLRERDAKGRPVGLRWTRRSIMSHALDHDPKPSVIKPAAAPGPKAKPAPEPAAAKARPPEQSVTL